MRKQGRFTKSRAGSIGSLLIPCLLLCLLTLSTIFTYANDDQQSITLNVQNASLVKVFAEIEKQTHYSFLYMQAVVKGAKPVNVKVANAPIEKVLEICFKDQPQLTYSIMDRVVVVKAKPVMNEMPVKKGLDDPIDISGRVTDEEGKPLAGANVKVKGSNSGVVTDAEGRFTLKNVEENAVLEISYVGHEPQMVYVKGQRMLVVNLKQNQSMLDETVVIAYGTTTKRLATGNVASVKAEDIAKQPVNNPLLALQGRVPGLFITQNTGLPGGGITVRLQGQNSISKGNDPLYVVDGIPYFSQLPSTGNDAILKGSGGAPSVGSFSGNPLSFINPSDIESIDILKDADATAIYGSRAANGAILITTKKGKIGKTKLEVNLDMGWGKVTRKLNMLNTRQYLDMRYEGIKNDGIVNIPNTDYDLKLWDTTRDTDWQNILIGGTSKYTNVNTGISGGSPSIQYFLGGNFHRETTVFPFDFEDRKGSIHLNLNSTSVNQRFQLKLSSSYLIDNNKLPWTDITQSAIQLEPVAPSIYNDDGTLNWAPNVSGNSSWTNPIAALYRKYKNRTVNLISNLILSYRLINGLDFRSSFGYTNTQTTDFYSSPLSTQRPENVATSIRITGNGNRNLTSLIIEPQLNYRLDLFKGRLEGLIGTTIQQNSVDVQSLRGEGYTSDAIMEDIRSASVVSVEQSIITQYKYNALFGRINCNWRDKYILNFSGRRDGSSRFGKKSQLHNFYSIAGAWLFSNEMFFDKKVPFISFGKIRASYGTTGNDQIGDYLFLNLYRSSGGIAYQNIPDLFPTSLPNPYLEWEETRKLQLGLDLGCLRDRILLNVTYALNRSSNQLLSYSLPSITGFGSVIQNFPATVQNESWEFSLNSINLKRDIFSWKSSFNLTIPKNKLVAFPDLSTSTYASTLIIGEPIVITRVLHYLGVDPITGAYQFADSHGNPTFTPNYATDLSIVISTLPKYYGGFQNAFTFKGFQLDFLFQFVKQRGAIVYYNNGGIPAPGVFRNGQSNQPVSVLNRWQKQGDNALTQAFHATRFPAEDRLNAVISSDANYSDASFIRLKNVSLSWNLPQHIQKKIFLQNCRLYAQGQNLLTITNYHGLDPENQGISALPPLKLLTVGLQIGL